MIEDTPHVWTQNAARTAAHISHFLYSVNYRTYLRKYRTCWAENHPQKCPDQALSSKFRGKRLLQTYISHAMAGASEVDVNI